MTDITHEEAEQFNDDVQCVVERLIEFDVILRDASTSSPVVLASSAITRQLFHRWFGLEYSMANMERIRYLRQVIAALNASPDSELPTA